MTDMDTTASTAKTFYIPGREDVARGLEVTFTPEETAPWQGIFQQGETTHTAILPHPDGTHYVVISAGAAYVVNQERALVIETTGCDITAHLPLPARRMLLLANPRKVIAIDEQGIRWISETLSYDGITGLSSDDTRVTGVGYDPGGNDVPFALSLVDGTRLPLHDETPPADESALHAGKRSLAASIGIAFPIVSCIAYVVARIQGGTHEGGFFGVTWQAALPIVCFYTAGVIASVIAFVRMLRSDTGKAMGLLSFHILLVIALAFAATLDLTTVPSFFAALH